MRALLRAVRAMVRRGASRPAARVAEEAAPTGYSPATEAARRRRMAADAAKRAADQAEEARIGAEVSARRTARTGSLSAVPPVSVRPNRMSDRAAPVDLEALREKISAYTIPTLRQKAASMGIAVNSRMSKGDLINRIIVASRNAV